MRRILTGAIGLLCAGFAVSANAQQNSPPQAQPHQIEQPKDAADSLLPPFLPPYYAPALQVGGTPLWLVDHGETNNIPRYVYATDDQAVRLTIESIKCSDAVCKTIFDNSFTFFNTQATKNSGRFRAATPVELRSEWWTGTADVFSLVLRLPNSIAFWTYSVPTGTRIDIGTYQDEITSLANRQRYEEALRLSNIEMGHWAPQIHEFARRLLKDGKKDQALTVLGRLLATSSFNYDAHMDLVANTGDPVIAKNSARIVFENAENPDLTTRAAAVLGLSEPSIESLAPLAKGERGLQLILIPLPPSNVRLIEDAAKIYQKITDVPVKIRRLPEEWQFGRPDRIPDQKRIQQAIVLHTGQDVDFTGWTIERYAEALLRTVESKDALNKFGMRNFVENLNKRPGQYRSDPYLSRFAGMLAKERSDDVRTMYVGVTEANIFSGNTNYIFSHFAATNRAGAALMSYSMMLAKTLGEPYESRKRLAERMAKELVPPSLQQLGIPRATDPSDPYSYSDGVERLAQKTLVLSAPVKEALDKFR